MALPPAEQDVADDYVTTRKLKNLLFDKINAHMLPSKQIDDLWQANVSTSFGLEVARENDVPIRKTKYGTSACEIPMQIDAPGWSVDFEMTVVFDPYYDRTNKLAKRGRKPKTFEISRIAKREKNVFVESDPEFLNELKTL